MSEGARFLVLGAGPAGLGAALRLSRRGFPVTVLEREASVGGNAGSFEFAGFQVDHGSHRLHPSCAPEILADIRGMLGPDLLDRPRHGRIHLLGKWLHFPLRAADLLRNAPPGFLAGAALDVLRKRRLKAGEDFASTLERGLGATICREFYFPYARKIWGMEATELDSEQARRRVSAASPVKLLRKIAGRSSRARFYYPRGGFGQISQAYRGAAEAAGAQVVLGAAVGRVETGAGGIRVQAGAGEFDASLLLSTIPAPQLARLVSPAAPPDVLASAAALRYRSMLLIYVALAADRFSEFDAHYFPSPEIAITRLSEPKHYGLADAPGRTVLCAELPCSSADAHWNAGEEALGKLVLESLERCGLPVRAPVTAITVRRIAYAYPIYALGYREHFHRLDAWIGSRPGIVSLGRQGLFAHDNTHHTLAMAYAAADCLDQEGRWDARRWQAYRKEFESFVVED